MNAQQIALKIQMYFYVTHAPNITRVIYKNQQTIDGFFQSYIDDEQILRKELKFRFIPIENARASQAEFDTSGVLNKRYSIVIDAAEVEDVVSVAYAHA
jgi:dGTP triphosphohydrolase